MNPARSKDRAQHGGEWLLTATTVWWPHHLVYEQLLEHCDDPRFAWEVCAGENARRRQDRAASLC